MAKKRFFQYVGKTPIIPISLKILVIFVSLLLLSNFMTNLINIQLSQHQIITLTNRLLVNQLKEMYSNASNQYQVYGYSQDKEASVNIMKEASGRDFTMKSSIALAFDRTGKVLFCNCANPKVVVPVFPDEAALKVLNSNYDKGITEGSVNFEQSIGEYFGVYKYHPDWNCYFLRAELRSDSRSYTYHVFGIVTLLILLITALFMLAGFYMFNKIFTNIKSITSSLYDMQQAQKLGRIDIDEASNDDVTYLAASFNSLSVTVNNLLNTFKKFVSKDIVAKAYSDHTVALEGSQRELTILFSDIKSFTYRTETLGNEIIDVLNVHYNSVIHDVHESGGVVGSIIGDAILAVFGTGSTSAEKSVKAIEAAWEITNVTAELREKMKIRKKEIEEKRKLTAAEERVYKAVLLDIGVGIDGGVVFYGNIGSDEHMANTVIGDNVNSASRLEGVTRIYHLPVIVSEYVKDEVLSVTERYKFYEVDTIQVKGKTKGKKIFYPIDTYTQGAIALSKKFDIYEQALKFYYDGDWKSARKLFKEISKDHSMEVCDVFLERMGMKNAPAKWSGLWTMTTK